MAHVNVRVGNLLRISGLDNHGRSKYQIFSSNSHYQEIYNYIRKVMDGYEIRSEDQNFILQVFAQEFEKRIRKNTNKSVQLEVPFSRDISEEYNLKLTREATMEKFQQAVKQIGSLKAPSSDGMHVVFHKMLEYNPVSQFLIQLEISFMVISKKVK